MLSRAIFHRRIVADLCEIEAIENEINDDDALAMEEGTSSSCISADSIDIGTGSIATVFASSCLESVSRMSVPKMLASQEE